MKIAHKIERRIHLAKTTDEFVSLAQEISSDHLAERQKKFLRKILLERFIVLERSTSDTLLFADKAGLTGMETYELYSSSLDHIKAPGEFLEILQRGMYIKGDKEQKVAFLSKAGEHLMKLKALDLSHPAVSARAKFLLESLDSPLQSGYLAKASSAKELADLLEFIQKLKQNGNIALTLNLWRKRFREMSSTMSADEIIMIAEKVKGNTKLEAEILQQRLPNQQPDASKGSSGALSPGQECLRKLFTNDNTMFQ